MHDPDGAHAVAQPHAGLVVHLAAAVVWGGHLDDPIGSDLGVARDSRVYGLFSANVNVVERTAGNAVVAG